MTALRALASLSLAVLLGSGAAPAQTTPAETDNPHDTANKDRPAPGDADKAQAQKAEEANPHSTMHKDRPTPGALDKEGAAEASTARPEHPGGRMGHATHGAMMSGSASPEAVLDRLNAADQGEIEMGKLAQQNGSTRVQELGRMLEQDHSKSRQQVKDLAQKKGISLGDQPKDAMAQHEAGEARQMHDRLAKLQGQEFDRSFARAMADEHRKDIDQLRKWRKSVGDKEVAALIDETLPVLERHLSAAKELARPAAMGRSPDRQ